MLNWLFANTEPIHLLPSVGYALLCGLLKDAKKPIIYATFLFPGVFLHEMAHFVASHFSNGKPVKIELFPKVENDRWILGEVVSTNVRWYNAWAIGLAPLALWGAPLGYLHLSKGTFLVEQDFWIAPLIGASMIAAWPSAQDLRVATRSAWIFAWVAFIWVLINLGA